MMKHINVKKTLMSVAVCALTVYGGLATARFTGTASMVPNKIHLISGQAKQVNAGTLVEPNWDSNGKELAAKGIRTGESVPKNPYIISNADWSSWAFIKVEIPRYSDGRDSVSLVGISDKWTLLQDTKSDDLHTLVYGYKTELAGGNSTKAEADRARTDSLFTAFKANELKGDKPFVNTLMVYGTLVQCDETDDIKEIVKKAHFDGSASSEAVYSITYELNGGTLSGEKYLYTEGESYTPPAPSKDGFKFTGWSPKSIGAGESGDKTFTAGWNANTLTIKYHTNGANRIDYGSTFDPSKDEVWGMEYCDYDVLFHKEYAQNGLSNIGHLTKDGYHSANGEKWRISNNNRLADATVSFVGYKGADVANFLGVLPSFKKGDVTVDLFPEWAANAYTVKYNANAPAGTTATGTTANSSHTYDKAKNLNANGYAVSNYTFDSWNTAANGSGTKYVNNASVKNLTTTNNGTVNLYAQWKAKVLGAIKYVLNGGSISNQKTSYTVENYGYKPPTPVKANYTFTGWTPASIAKDKTGDITFTAGWKANTLGAVKFNLNGGTGNISSERTSYTVENYGYKPSVTPTRTGYTFTGWSPASIASGTNGDVTFTATWKANTYAVKYNSNAPTGKTASGTMANSSHTYDIAKALTANGFTMPNYSFASWNTRADGKGTTYANRASVKNLSATNGATVNLYARWKANILGAVKFNLNGGTANTSSERTNYTVENYGYKPSVTPSREGYTFTGWSPASITSGTKGDVTFTANWRENKLTINYHSENAEQVKYFDEKYVTLDATKDVVVFQRIATYSKITLSKSDFDGKYVAEVSFDKDGLIDVDRFVKTGYHSTNAHQWKVASNGKFVADNTDMSTFDGSDAANFFGVLDEFKKGDVIVDLMPAWVESTLTIKYHSIGATGWAGSDDVDVITQTLNPNVDTVVETSKKMLYSKPYTDYSSLPYTGLWNVERLKKTGYHPTPEHYWHVKNNGAKVYDDTNFTSYSVADLAKWFGVLDEFKKGDVIVDLIPEWEENTLVVNYHSSGAEKWAGSRTLTLNPNTDTVVETSKKMLYSKPYTNYSSDPYNGLWNVERLKKTGYHPDPAHYWYVKNNGTKVYDDANFSSYSIADLAKWFGVLDEFKNSNVTVDLYAKWEKN